MKINELDYIMRDGMRPRSTPYPWERDALIGLMLVLVVAVWSPIVCMLVAVAYKGVH